MKMNFCLFLLLSSFSETHILTLTHKFYYEYLPSSSMFMSIILFIIKIMKFKTLD